MRLIDVDALLRGKEDHDRISTHVIWNAPTVDAVPVEWIKRWSKEPMTEKDMELAGQCGWDILDWMIADWQKRKEE